MPYAEWEGMPFEELKKMRGAQQAWEKEIHSENNSNQSPSRAEVIIEKVGLYALSKLKSLGD